MSSSLADLSIAANVAPHVGSDVTRLPSGEYVNTCACARDLGRDKAFASTTISGPSQASGYLHTGSGSTHFTTGMHDSTMVRIRLGLRHGPTRPRLVYQTGGGRRGTGRGVHRIQVEPRVFVRDGDVVDRSERVGPHPAPKTRRRRRVVLLELIEQALEEEQQRRRREILTVLFGKAGFSQQLRSIQDSLVANINLALLVGPREQAQQEAHRR